MPLESLPAVGIATLSALFVLGIAIGIYRSWRADDSAATDDEWKYSVESLDD